MTKTLLTKTAAEALNTAKHVLIIQADNPDADSLASALALEEILGELGKTTSLYCGVDIPKYLAYIPGYDRVSNELPNNFDVSIIVDCSTITLLEKLVQNNQLGALKSRPCIVFDHHSSTVDLPFEYEPAIDQNAVSTGELLFEVATENKWKLTRSACDLLACSILADSLGLTTENVTAKSVFTLAKLVESGVNLAELDDRRRAAMSKPLEIIAYKAKLLERIEYFIDNQLAIVSIPWKEIETYSPLYNPGVLALEELRFAEGVKISVAIKSYPDGKITGKLRCNFGSTIAGDLAAKFGGGGHPGAAGFKVFGWKLDELQKELIAEAAKLLEAESKQ